MNVLAVISSAGIYGAESMLLNLLQELRSLGEQPVLAILRNSHHPNVELADLARQRGLAVEVIPCQGRLDTSVPGRLRDCIRKYQIDVVHTHGYKADLYGYFATRRPKVPLVATCHNWTGVTASVSLYGRLDRLALRRFDRVAAVSDTVAQILLSARVPADRLAVIPNGVPTKAFAARQTERLDVLSGQSAPVIGMVGRLVKEKGFAYLLRGLRVLRERFPGTKCLIVGEGPQEMELRQCASDEGVGEAVLFAGYCSDLPRVYHSMDVLVLPSFVEGMPMVVLEAMAAGKPVIATRVGAIPKLITPGQEGMLVEPGNTDALVEALSCLLSNAEMQRSMGQRGQALVHQNYSATVMAKRYLEFYSQAVPLMRIQPECAAQCLEDRVDVG